MWSVQGAMAVPLACSGLATISSSRSLSWTSNRPSLALHDGACARRSRAAPLRVVAASDSHMPQNVDLPAVLPKKKKKPWVVPFKLMRKQRRPGDDKPPGNGMLVPSLIPVTHVVMRAMRICQAGVARLAAEIPVKSCRYCTEVHVGPVGHRMRTCQGPRARARDCQHDWLKGSVDDIIVPVEAYHLEDRLDRPVTHDRRFDVERILAVEELCIQAGFENPKYPTKRYTEPVQPSRRKSPGEGELESGRGESIRVYERNVKKYPHPLLETGWTELSVTEEEEKDLLKTRLKAGGYSSVESLASDENEESEVQAPEEAANLLDILAEDPSNVVAEKTLVAWEVLRDGTGRLMRKYRVVACGYCPEVHVGPKGHRARNCGAFKHQWRDGMHGWQAAALDEIIPSQYVWHVRDMKDPPMESALKRYFGKTPAIVALCVHSGAKIPPKYRPMMRLDIVVPTLEEVDLVV